MGCDIHLFIEKRYKDSKKWVKVNGFCPFSIPRYYKLFTILAGVRDRNWAYKRISKPRGIPKDISKELKDCIRDHAEHSFSYHNLYILKRYKWGELSFDVFSNVMMPMLEKLAEEVGEKNVRIVFGFDS